MSHLRGILLNYLLVCSHPSLGSYFKVRNILFCHIIINYLINWVSSICIVICKALMCQSIPSLTIPRVTPGDSHIPVAPGVGFSLLCLAWGSAQGFAWGVLNQSKSSIILKKAQFLFCLLNN